MFLLIRNNGKQLPYEILFFSFFPFFFSWYHLKKHFQPQIQEESFHIGHPFMSPARLLICRNHPKPDPGLGWCWEGTRASWELSYIVPSPSCWQEHQQLSDFFCWVSSPKLGHTGLNLLFCDSSEQRGSDIPGSEFCTRLFRSNTLNFAPGQKKGKKKNADPS